MCSKMCSRICSNLLVFSVFLYNVQAMEIVNIHLGAHISSDMIDTYLIKTLNS